MLGRARAARLALPARVARRHGRAVAGQDPREHGDRPQRHARPVGLDERPRHQLLDLGLGHGLDGRGVAALPQLRAPHLHEHPRQGPRPRLRDHAHRPAPEVAPGLPAAAALQPAADGALRVGRGRSTTSTSTRSARARSPRSSVRRSSRASPARRAGRSSRTTSPGRCSAARSATAIVAGGRRRRASRRRRGLRPWRGAERAPSRAVRDARPRAVHAHADRQRRREHRPQRLVLRDHLLRPLPRPDLHLQPGRGRRTRRAAAGTCASSLGAANIEGGPLFHVSSGNLGYQVEHHLYPDMPSTRYAEIAPRVREICERYGLPYNTGPLHTAARHGAAHDPAPGLPRRQAAAEARCLHGPLVRGKGEQLQERVGSAA